MIHWGTLRSDMHSRKWYQHLDQHHEASMHTTRCFKQLLQGRQCEGGSGSVQQYIAVHKQKNVEFELLYLLPQSHVYALQ